MHTEGSSEPTILLKWSPAPRPQPADAYLIRTPKTSLDIVNDQTPQVAKQGEGFPHSNLSYIQNPHQLQFFLSLNKIQYWVLQRPEFRNWHFCPTNAKCATTILHCDITINQLSSSSVNNFVTIIYFMPTVWVYVECPLLVSSSNTHRT